MKKGKYVILNAVCMLTLIWALALSFYDMWGSHNGFCGIFSKRLSPAYAKFGKAMPLDKADLREFGRLCGLGEHSYECNWPVSVVNHKEFMSDKRSCMGWIRRAWHPIPTRVYFSYNPFSHVLYMSDAWDDGYQDGLLVREVLPRLIRYSEWDEQYPRWMETEIEGLKCRMAHSEVPVKISAFYDGKDKAYNYFVPYMHATFGNNVMILSDDVVPLGNNHQQVVERGDRDRDFDEIDITIGKLKISTDSQRIMQNDFFIQLTNALTYAADSYKAPPSGNNESVKTGKGAD